MPRPLFIGAAVLKSFFKKHGSVIEATSKTAGAGLSAYLILSGQWTFLTIAQAVTAFGISAGEIRKLYDQADKQAEKLNRKERLSFLLSLAAREAYIEAVSEVLPRTLADWKTRGVKSVITSKDEIEDLGPECDFRHKLPLPDIVKPTFDFLEGKLLTLLAQAEVPNLERAKIARAVREEAAPLLLAVIAENQARYSGIAFRHILTAADATLSAGNVRISAGVSPFSSSVTAAFEPDAAPILNLAPQTRPSNGSQPDITASALESIPKLPDALKKIYDDRFAAARREVDTGSSEKGAQAFAELIEELRQLASPELNSLLARCLHNRGIALFNSDLRSEAAVCFEEAITFPEISAKTKAGEFFAHYCRKDYPQALLAIRRLCAEHPEETDFVVYEAECLVRLDHVPAAFELLNRSTNRSEMFFTLKSQLLANQEKFEESKHAADEGLDKYPDSCQLRAAAAFAEAKPIFDRLHGERSVRRYARPTDAETLRGLKTKYAAVATAAKHSALRIIAAEAYAMMGSICLALREERMALLHLDESLALAPNNSTVWGNKHLALSRLDDFAGARAVARQAAEIFGEAEALGREVATWLEEGKSEVACDLMLESFQRNSSLKLDSNLRVLWLQSLALAKRQPLAECEAVAFSELPNLSSHDLIVVAEVFESLGQRTKADALIERAEREVTGDEAIWVRQIAGLIFYRRDAWAEAIRRLGSDGMDPVESTHVAEILICLINLRDLRGALSLGERLRELRRADDQINRALAHVYLQIGREVDAEPLLNELVAKHGRYSDRISLFRVMQLLHPLRIALPVLEDAVKLNPDRLEGHLFLSEAYYVLQQYAMSLDEARKAYRLAPEQPETVRNYARFLVAPIDHGLLTEEDRQIVQKALADESVFQRVEIPEKNGELDLTNILEALRSRREHASRVLELYRGRRLPLASIADALGRSVFEMWWSLVHAPDERINMANGDGAEQESELSACDDAKSVVLDATALLTLAELGLLDVLGKTFTKIYFDAETLAALKKDHAMLSTHRTAEQHIVYHEGRLVISETSAAEHHSKYRRLDELIEFLHGGGKVLARGPSGEVWANFKANERWQKLADCLIDGALGPALIAKSETCAYYCDDLGLRLIAGHELGVIGFSSQSLLRRANREGMINDETYNTAITKLLQRNYRFVSTDRQFLLRHLKDKKFEIDPVSERLLREIGTTTFGQTPGSMELGVAAGFLWFNVTTGGLTSRTEWLKLIAQGLAKIPSGKNSIPMFMVGLLVDLRHFPEAFIGLSDALIYDVGLSKQLMRRVYLARKNILDLVSHDTLVFNDTALVAKWIRAIEYARNCRKIVGSDRRL